MDVYTPNTARTYLTTAGAAAGIIARGSLLLYALRVVSSSGQRRYVQLFDAAGVPPDGTVPHMLLQVDPNGLYEWHCQGTPRRWDLGCVWGFSSTGNIHTLAAPECWLEAQYLAL